MTKNVSVEALRVWLLRYNPVLCEELARHDQDSGWQHILANYGLSPDFCLTNPIDVSTVMRMIEQRATCREPSNGH